MRWRPQSQRRSQTSPHKTHKPGSGTAAMVYNIMKNDLNPGIRRAVCTQIRTETDACKEHSGIFALISRTNFSRNLRGLPSSSQAQR
jgi:hypothetical protein